MFVYYRVHTSILNLINCYLRINMDMKSIIWPFHVHDIYIMKSLNCVCVFLNVRIEIIVKNNNPVWSQGIEMIVIQHDNDKLKQVDMAMRESEITKINKFEYKLD